ncbi:Hsp20/alpha crystallin family protein [Peristeroidobacter soli]|jgi:HSP20 family molecular chaperone IbpA|uniref:Hsp20/alpha crystallin family protein n=1 Tax=Peristeroidobacter soli TaxID=2497877 RepID=UPI00101D6C65|nr:Hsp20/alpha crystallin family protein [Peristeroidobacter soli]
MAIRNPPSWMWAEACEMMERAQQLQRQFFRFGRVAASAPLWEPPIDILAHGNEVHVAVALPGVAADHIEVRTDSGLLIVNATRALPVTSRATAVHRLEIPYGRFERRIALPEGRYQLLEQAYTNGCLFLRLAQR